MMLNKRSVAVVLIASTMVIPFAWALGDGVSTGRASGKAVRGIVEQVSLFAGEDNRVYQIIKLNDSIYVTPTVQPVAEGFEIELRVLEEPSTEVSERVMAAYPNATPAESLRIKSFPTRVDGEWFRYYPEGRRVKCETPGCK